jgi:hypothetical protein
LSLTPRPSLKCGCMKVVRFLTGPNAETTMKASFLRKRKMTRGVLVLDGNLANLEPDLRRKNFHVINLPSDAMDASRNAH